MADEASDAGEKEFEATEQKRRQARRDGDVAQSKEANGFAVVLGLILAACLFQFAAGASVFDQLSAILYHADSYAYDVFEAGGENADDWALGVFAQLAPLGLVIVALVLATLFVQGAVNLSVKSLKPDLKKLSPVENIKKKYGPRGLTDFAKDSAKMAFAAVIAFVFLVGFIERNFASSRIDKTAVAEFTFFQLLALIACFTAFQFVLAAIDLPLQRRLLSSRLKMSREELKKETKESEGDPHLKQARRKKAASLSNREMLANVKASTVVMVNPEHYAVALKWDPSSGMAPVCVAKGVDHLAAQIRETAIAAGVPVYRDPPATRSIYALVNIDQEIRPEHFAAVAAAVQYVDRVRRHLSTAND